MTYLLLDTSTPFCRLSLVIDGSRHDFSWEANRSLADGLLKFIGDNLASFDKKLTDIDGIGVMHGPGSFTGLRIGLTVLNTIASNGHVPIVGVDMSDDWQRNALNRLEAGNNDNLVMPVYGAEANITKPRK